MEGRKERGGKYIYLIMKSSLGLIKKKGGRGERGRMSKTKIYIFITHSKKVIQDLAVLTHHSAVIGEGEGEKKEGAVPQLRSLLDEARKILHSAQSQTVPGERRKRGRGERRRTSSCRYSSQNMRRRVNEKKTSLKPSQLHRERGKKKKKGEK